MLSLPLEIPPEKICLCIMIYVEIKKHAQSFISLILYLNKIYAVTIYIRECNSIVFFIYYNVTSIIIYK